MMKKAFLLIVLLFFSLSVFSQSYWVSYLYSGSFANAWNGSGVGTYGSGYGLATISVRVLDSNPIVLEGAVPYFYHYYKYETRYPDGSSGPVETQSDYLSVPVDQYFKDGFKVSGSPQNYTCALSLEVKPVVFFTETPGNSVCGDESLELIANEGWEDSKYQWYYRKESDADWVLLADRSGTSVEITRNDIPDLSYGQNVYFGVAVGGTPLQMHSPAGESNTTSAYQFYPPIPPITLESFSPECIDGVGTITVTHDATPEAGVGFVYTITKLVPQESGSCPAYSDSTPRDPVVGEDGISYCEGFVATWNKTFAEGESPSIDLSTITPLTNSGDPFNLGVGYFEVLVESTAGNNLPTCVARGYTVITEPDARSITGITTASPSCNGREDGSVTFNLNRVNGSIAGATRLPTGQYRTDAIYSGSPTITLYDGCGSIDPISLGTVTVGSGDDLSLLVTTPTSPTCNSNGQIEVTATPENLGSYRYYGDGQQVHSATTSSYTYQTLGSGNHDLQVQVDGCLPPDAINQSLNDLPATSLVVRGSAALCSGGDGTISFRNIQKTNGPIDLEYVIWDGDRGHLGSTQVSVGTITSTSDVEVSLMPNSYYVYLEDHCGAAIDVFSVANPVVVDGVTALSFSVENTEIACFDGSDGSTSVELLGGTGPYSMTVTNESTGIVLVSNEAIQATPYSYPLTGLSRGQHRVVVTESGNCSNSVEHTFDVLVSNSVSTPIGYVPSLHEYSEGLHIQCHGDSNGQIDVSLSGGNPFSGTDPYVVLLRKQEDAGFDTDDYSLSVSGSDYTFSGLGSGTYYLDIEDANGCHQVFDHVDSLMLLEEPSALVFTAPVVDDFANAASIASENGDWYLQCNGDTSLFTAHFSNGVSPYSLTLYQQDMDGIFVEREDQTSSGVTGSSFTFPHGLDSGAYRVELIDYHGCMSSHDFHLYDASGDFETSGIVLSSPGGHGANTTCYDTDDATIEAQVTGGVGRYTYTLDTEEIPFDVVSNQVPSSSHIFGSLRARSATNSSVHYTLEIYDEAGCLVKEGSQEVLLTFPDSVSLSEPAYLDVMDTDEVRCHGETGRVLLSSTGGDGTGTYTLSLNGGIPVAFDMVDSTNLISLPAGQYLATVSDALGCSTLSAVQIELTQPDTEVVVDAVPSIHPNCIGGSDGFLEVEASGGRGQFQYSLDGTTWQGSMRFEGLEAEGYTAYTLDRNECIATMDATVPEQPNPLTLDLIDKQAPSCHHGTDGWITVQSSNYELKDGDQLLYRITGGHYGSEVYDTLVSAVPDGTNTVTFRDLWDTDGVVPALVSSHYEIWVEDVFECVDTARQYLNGPALSLIAPDPLILQLDTLRPPSCYAGENGWFVVQASGGVPPYEFSINNDAFVLSNRSSGTGFEVGGLESGIHTVYLRDSQYQENQPTCMTYLEIDVPIGFNMDFSASEGTPVSCAGASDGAVALLIDTYYGHDSSFVYDPLRLHVDWYQGTGKVGSGFDLSSLKRGLYTASVTYDQDTIVCEEPHDLAVLGPFEPLRVSSLKAYQSPCGNPSGGRVTFGFEGGQVNEPFVYNVDGTGWVVANNSPVWVFDLGVGEHQLQLSQNNGLCLTDTTFLIEQQRLDVDTLLVRTPDCATGDDGQVALLAANIEQPEYFVVGDLLPVANGAYEDLTYGDHFLVVRNSANHQCVSDTMLFSFALANCTDNTGSLQVVVATQPTTCPGAADGSAEAFIQSGGLAPYKYVLNGDEIDSPLMRGLSSGSYRLVVEDALSKRDTISFEIDRGTPIDLEGSVTLDASCMNACDGRIDALLFAGGSGQYAVSWDTPSAPVVLPQTGLCAGNYVYTVRDMANSSCTFSGSVTIDEPKQLTVSLLSSVRPTCPGEGNGRLDVVAEGGTAPYRYQWVLGGASIAGTRLSNISSGSYTVTVTDDHGCEVTELFTLSDRPEMLIADTVLVSPSCSGGSDGRIELTVVNDSAPFVMWSDGRTGTSISGLRSGPHDFTITNTSGCSVSGSIYLPERPPLTVVVTQTDNLCFEACEGDITLSISGGVAPYYLSWEHGPRTTHLSDLCSGNYSYVVQDHLGCELSGTVNISSPDPVTIALNTKVDVSCFGSVDGSLEVSASGGVSPYSYEWAHGASGSLVSGIDAGTYVVEATDSNGCSVTASYAITEPEVLFTSSELVSDLSCNGGSDGSIVVNAQGGTEPYTYNWSHGASGSELTGLVAGSYELMLSDSKGCLFEKEFELSTPSAVALSNVVLQDPTCHNESTGSIHIETIGGSGPYAFLWSSGQLSEDIDELLFGDYELTITDANGCELTEQFRLSNPDPLVVTGIDDYYVMCDGGYLYLSPAGEWATYDWVGPDAFRSSAASIEAELEGEYDLTVTDGNQCVATLNTYLEISPNALQADFIRLSEAVAYTPIVLVDLSMPIPGTVEWVLPDSSGIVVNDEDETSIELIFTDAGIYEIGIRTTLGDCVSELYKEITVEDRSLEEDSGARQLRTMDVSAYPNPVFDHLNVLLKAPSKEATTVQLLSLDKEVLFQQTLQGRLDYLLDIDVQNLYSGVYLLYVRSGKSVEIKRIAIIK